MQLNPSMGDAWPICNVLPMRCRVNLAPSSYDVAPVLTEHAEGAVEGSTESCQLPMLKAV